MRKVTNKEAVAIVGLGGTILIKYNGRISKLYDPVTKRRYEDYKLLFRGLNYRVGYTYFVYGVKLNDTAFTVRGNPNSIFNFQCAYEFKK